MVSENPKIETILKFLSDEIFRALLYNSIAKVLRDNFDNPQFTMARTFFLGSYYACLRECLITVSKIIISDRDSISIQYLINYAEQNTNEFNMANPQQVRELSAKFRDELPEFEEFAKKLKILRDKELAHIDKKSIYDPKSIIPRPIEFYELDTCIDHLKRIINKYMLLYNSTLTFYPDFYNLVQEEVDLIISSMKKSL